MTADAYLDYGNPFTEDEGHSEEEVEVMEPVCCMCNSESKGSLDFKEGDHNLIRVGEKFFCVYDFTFGDCDDEILEAFGVYEMKMGTMILFKK